MTSTASIWEILVRTGRKIVTTEDVATLARRMGRRTEHAIRHLRRAGYLAPLFKGYYYVRTAEEVRFRNPRHNSLELFAMAAERKGIGTWYYGLHTALRLNGMTHEDRRSESIISDSFYRIRGIPIAGRRFVIHKWKHDLTSFGLIVKRPYRYSDPEKTILDLAYWDHCRKAKGRPVTLMWADHLATVRPKEVRKYLRHYPDSVARAVEERL